MQDSSAVIRERHFDGISRSFVLASLSVLLVALLLMPVARLTGFALPWWVWGVWLLTCVVMGALFAIKGWYEVIVDGVGVRRTGMGGSQVTWSEVTDLAQLPTRQRHLALVGGPPQEQVWGESGFAKPYGLPRGTIVFQASDELRAAITARVGEVRVLDEKGH